MKTYTISERATVIYNTVLDVFNWNQSSDRTTPLDFVRKQFKDVPAQGTICVPGAGIGTYVLVALEKGFLPENITAVEIDPMYYELGSGMFNRLGVNYVQADFLTWKPEMQFDVVIGNPPYSDTENVKGAGLGGCSKGLDDKFFLKCMEMSPFVSLIIRSKYFAKKSSKFRRKLFSSGHIQSMEALPASVFPTIGLTETVVVTYNVNHFGPTKVTFQGGEEKEILLTEETCLKFTNSAYVSSLDGNLAARHSMGSVGLNQMKDGDFPMVLTLNSREADIKVRFVPAEQHVHGLNEHGVVMNRVYGGYGLGKVFVKPFDYSISRSAIMLKTNSEEESETLCEYLRSPEIQELANINKISNVLSKELFKTIKDPLL
jgi:predicted RNA methylase